MLVQIEEQLQKEAAEDAQFRNPFGTRWARTQSSTLTKTIRERLNRFAANLKQAAESDTRIERSAREHSALMLILDCHPIESALPSLTRRIMSLNASEDAIVGGLKQSLKQLENLGAQRAGLEDMLKEMKRKDDILTKLMAFAGSHDDLFRNEISKYDQICKEISQNLEAQQLLLHIQVQNDEFAAVFSLEDYKASREKSYGQIEAAMAKFREIKENINEGLKFYVTLQDAIAIVKQQCSDFVMTRNIQCRETIDNVQRQIAGLSFHQPLGPGNTPNIYQSPQQPTMPTYAQNPPYYHAPNSNHPYPSPHSHPPPVSHEYGLLAYPGWRGPYYNAPHQQMGSMPMPNPPYTAISNPPPHQSGYYRQ